MVNKALLIFAVLCTAILIGCSKTDDNSNTTASNSNKTTSASTPSTTTPPSTGDKVGIPECDDYIAKYEACAGKVPEAGRAAYKSGLDQTRAAWKKLADDPATKGSLAAACKQAAEQQAAAWKMYGCTN